MAERRAPQLFQVASGEIERRKSSWADPHRLFRCQSTESALDRANRCRRALFQRLHRGPAKAHGLVMERCNSGYVVRVAVSAFESGNRIAPTLRGGNDRARGAKIDPEPHA